jgi:hypothetical protein
MNTAQRTFIGTSWIFLVLAGLLFLVPTDFPSAQAAAWTCLGVAIASHVALLAAIIFDAVTPSGPATVVSE